MRKALIDYLLSEECKYTSSERLLLFVLCYAIRAGRDSIGTNLLAKATAMPRSSTYRALRGLKDKSAIALNDSTYVIKETEFLPLSLPSPSPRGGGDYRGGRDNTKNIIYNKDARAPEAKTVSDRATSETKVSNRATSETKVSDKATSETNVREDIKKLKQLENERLLRSHLPKDTWKFFDSQGAIKVCSVTEEQRRFLESSRKQCCNAEKFFMFFDEALEAVGDVDVLIAAQEADALKSKADHDDRTNYIKRPENWLADKDWYDLRKGGNGRTGGGCTGTSTYIEEEGLAF